MSTALKNPAKTFSKVTNSVAFHLSLQQRIMIYHGFYFLLIFPLGYGQESFSFRKTFRSSVIENPVIQLAAQVSDQAISSTANVFTKLIPEGITRVVSSFTIPGIPSLDNNRNTIDLTNTFLVDFNIGQSNEDVSLSIGGLLLKYNQPVESHKVQTEDGYILGMFRIPSNGSVVFLMHGLFGSADDFVITGPDSGLAYLLAREGYDVWMGNARGNKHSRNHIHLKPSDSEFWNFSWHEIGVYDLPAMIDHVLTVTDQTTLKYIGHSQGTTTFFVLASERPEYNEKISLMVALSPVAFMSNMRSPVIKLLAPGSPLIHSVIKSLGAYEFLPDNRIIRNFKKVTCGFGELAEILCSNVVFLIVGFDLGQINATNLPVLFSHIPSGSSVKQMMHYSQGITSGNFAKYDYGINGNKKMYGTERPPNYALDKVSAPVSLFYSDADWLAHPLDVEKLSKGLGNVVDMYKVPYEQFNHLDFIFAKDFKTLIYEKLRSSLSIL